MTSVLRDLATSMNLLKNRSKPRRPEEEHEPGERKSAHPLREIQKNKWITQCHGLSGDFVDHDSHESVPARKVLKAWLENLESRTKWGLSQVTRILNGPTGADRQLEVWRETNSTYEVARDIAERTRASVKV